MTIRTIPAGRHGFSLIELIVAIVIIGTAVIGIMSVMNFLAARSADPAIQEQALLIGEAYLEEILLKPFLDPTPKPEVTNVCPPQEAGGRSVYDNVCDYNGLVNVGARDQFNTPISGLEGYTISVTVTGDATVTLGPATNQIVNDGGSNPFVRVLRVDVRVQGPLGQNVTLTGYRTNFNCNVSKDKACLPL